MVLLIIVKFCKKIKNVLDLGYQPLADDLKNFNLIRYKLLSNINWFLQKCILLQNNYIVDDRVLYTKNYHYRPGITKDVVNNFKEMSLKLSKFTLNSKSVVADIGCNDGSLLKEFKNLGILKTVGIDPTNTIKYAPKYIKTIQDFMNLKCSKKALNFYGKIDLITTTNVFAHTNKLKDFILIVFIIENHYLGAIIKKENYGIYAHIH